MQCFHYTLFALYTVVHFHQGMLEPVERGRMSGGQNAIWEIDKRLVDFS